MTNVIQLDCRDGVPDVDVARLSAGDSVELTARVLTLRDASAARLANTIERGEPLPVSLDGQII
jgi:fumarate hydratase subunit beta